MIFIKNLWFTVVKIPLWKRNIIRMCVTLVIAALAVILREYFAYISALGGQFTWECVSLAWKCNCKNLDRSIGYNILY